MWQKEKKDSSIFIALLLALATIPTAATVTAQQSALAQSSTNAPSPALSTTSPTSTTTLRIDGSSSMAAINQTLKERFEKKSSGTKVDFATNGTDAALKALKDGKIDLAAISRELTPEEEAQGLKQVLLHREKIAIVVGKDNPFLGSLTSKRFAKIFRGEITDWSQVGGPAGKIRLIDHPATSNTREAFRDYPVFQTAKFATGSTALQLDEENTPEIVKQLGKDGISYVLANQVPKLQGVRVLKMNHILPEDSRYPFSLPSVYVYHKTSSPRVSSLVDFATAPLGQKAIEEAIASEATALASGSEPVVTVTNTSSTTETASTASPSADTANTSKATSAATASPSATTSPNNLVTNQTTIGHQTSADNRSFLNSNKNAIWEGLTPLLLSLLPLFALGGFLLWWFRGKRSSDHEANNGVESVLNLPLQEASATTMGSSLSNTHKHSSSNVVENSTLITSNRALSTTSSVSNQVANSTNGGSATLADGTVLAVGTSSPLWLKFFDRGSSSEVTHKTTQDNNSAEIPSVGSREVVVTREPEVTEVTASPKQPNVPVAVDLEAPVMVVNSKYHELPDVSITSNVEPRVTEVTASFPKQPDLPQVALDLVADAAEPTAQTRETETANGIKTVIQQPEETTNTAPVVDKAGFESHIILTSRTPKWAYACWEISDHQKQALRQQGGSQLVVRLYDVTNSDQSPQQIQQYECEETIHDRYVAIPVSGRDYMAEIGYITNNNRWLLLARSAIVHVSSRTEQDFWFVADAELIIHGAAEPGSTVTIEGHTIKLKSDGTFHLRIPFTDSPIDYAMKAVAANAEEAKTIHMQFFQGTPK